MHFIVHYQPRRENFIATMSPAENQVMAEHFEYLKGLLGEGKMLLAGRREDGLFGIAIFQEVSEAEARSILANDPVIREDLFSASLGQFRLPLCSFPV